MNDITIKKVREIVSKGKITRAGLARAAGLHANTLRDCTEESWNPTADTLGKLNRFMTENDEAPVLVGIEEIIEEARNGRMYILVDDEDRENEGDLIIPAQMATPNAVNFMATHGRGLICLALTAQRGSELGLELMSSRNRTSHETAFTVAIEAREGVTTGISAADRARTVSVAIDSSKGADDIVTPGHVFPLLARPGGVLVRAGHTEAAVDISRLAGLNPSGVICEIMNEDGTMARLDDLISFGRKHGLKIGTIRDLIEYRMRHDHLVKRTNESTFQSDYGGDWRVASYRNSVDGSINFVLQKGNVIPGQPVLTRMHAISIFDDVLGRSGDKKRVLQRCMAAIGEEGNGVIVVLVPNKSASLETELGGADRDTGELREYGIGAQILADIGVHDMILLTNSNHNVVGLQGYGISVVEERPIPE
ncbi:3, 4-dihydroxy-2-butanone 4-phosphate synthase [Aurantiacibacter atlanticus]|uniref:3,4-dihydroxy-2-butanone 4-phosphate synthase n=1 Tax=Aurantiacibacter atlanticus TaxID=1648404 RepID=A0A0H4VHI0_9SPHN|nr:3,4-dihydroxy-2-butanone-4-phosphate synthase [Aurantiacibacter atlanticus]AKQ42331.1 3, 4-dihydroxy-2-butanone 4-phosphate synthase [Aurantiacibacter atlanticus]MDF1834794.1 3,4-dihydroxy-2-butanone-4-phosphate synthase [Alteraurantiacibacter sp. bin_em_oilr2.035]